MTTKKVWTVLYTITQQHFLFTHFAHSIQITFIKRSSLKPLANRHPTKDFFLQYMALELQDATRPSISKHGNTHRKEIQILNCFPCYHFPPLSSSFLPFPVFWWMGEPTQKRGRHTHTRRHLILLLYYIMF